MCYLVNNTILEGKDQAFICISVKFEIPIYSFEGSHQGSNNNGWQRGQGRLDFESPGPMQSIKYIILLLLLFGLGSFVTGIIISSLIH